MPDPVAAASRPGLVVAAPGGQPLVQLDRPGLFEQVDHGVAVGAEAERAAGVGQRLAGPTPSARSRSVVGQMQASWFVAPAGGCPRRSGGWRGRRWSGGRAPRPRRPGRPRPAGGGHAGLVLGPLLRQVEVQRRRRSAAQAATVAMPPHRPPGRCGFRPPPAARAGRAGPARSAQAPASPSPKRSWARPAPAAEPGPQVAGVDQGGAGSSPRPPRPAPPHPVGVGIGWPAGSWCR